MKCFMGVVVTAVCLTLCGCGDSKEATNIVDGVGKDDIAEYNRLLQESQSAYAEADKAMEEAGVMDGGQAEEE